MTSTYRWALDNDTLTIFGLTTEDALALVSVLKERARQDKKWGEQNHGPVDWLNVDLEELGEASMSANRATWDLRGQLGLSSGMSLIQHVIRIARSEDAQREFLDKLEHIELDDYQKHLENYVQEMTETAAVALVAVASAIRQRRKNSI